MTQEDKEFIYSIEAIRPRMTGRTIENYTLTVK